MRITRYDSFEKINKILTKAGLEPAGHKDSMPMWNRGKQKIGFYGWWTNPETGRAVFVTSITDVRVLIREVDKVGVFDKPHANETYTNYSNILATKAIEYTK